MLNYEARRTALDGPRLGRSLVPAQEVSQPRTTLTAQVHRHGDGEPAHQTISGVYEPHGRVPHARDEAEGFRCRYGSSGIPDGGVNRIGLPVALISQSIMA